MIEYQRTGRNKSTVINQTYISGGEFRNKFDKITDDKAVSRILYNKAKEMLHHRSGTKYEDMYWFDADTGDVIASVIDSEAEEKVRESLFDLMIAEYYDEYYKLNVEDERKFEYDAQLYVLNAIKESYNIDFREVD